MIVAEEKSVDEMKALIGDARKVLVAGCGTCVTVCFAGGAREAGRSPAGSPGAGRGPAKPAPDRASPGRQCTAQVRPAASSRRGASRYARDCISTSRLTVRWNSPAIAPVV